MLGGYVKSLRYVVVWEDLIGKLCEWVDWRGCVERGGCVRRLMAWEAV